MTAIAAQARAAAVNFEAKKTGFGQAQDGWSLTLRIQDEDVPDGVAKAKKGTRYQVALVEIGDDELPVSHQRETTPAHVEATPRPVHQREPAGDDKRRRAFSDISPAQQAGMLCNDVGFRRFIDEKICTPCTTVEQAADIVREFCEVESRSELTVANSEWARLLDLYRTWQIEAEVVPA